MTILEILYTILFTLCGLASGIYSLKMHRKYNPDSIEPWRMCLVFLINTLGWFICIPLAIKFKTII